jgi:hypothetical protein
MDAAGARELQKRLEGQAHWLQAEAVSNGLQPGTDPDAAELEELRDGIRIYRLERSSSNRAADRVARRMCKRLVEGRWETFFLPETVEP